MKLSALIRYLTAVFPSDVDRVISRTLSSQSIHNGRPYSLLDAHERHLDVTRGLAAVSTVFIHQLSSPSSLVVGHLLPGELLQRSRRCKDEDREVEMGKNSEGWFHRSHQCATHRYLKRRWKSGNIVEMVQKRSVFSSLSSPFTSMYRDFPREERDAPFWLVHQSAARDI